MGSLARRAASLALLLGSLLLLDGCSLAHEIKSMSEVQPGECVICGRVRGTSYGQPVGEWGSGGDSFEFVLCEGDNVSDTTRLPVEGDGVFAYAVPARRWRLWSSYETYRKIPLGGTQWSDYADVFGRSYYLTTMPEGNQYMKWGPTQTATAQMDDDTLYNGIQYEPGKVYFVGDHDVGIGAKTDGGTNLTFTVNKKIVFTVAPDLAAALQQRHGIDPASIIPAVAPPPPVAPPDPNVVAARKAAREAKKRAKAAAAASQGAAPRPAAPSAPPDAPDAEAPAAAPSAQGVPAAPNQAPPVAQAPAPPAPAAPPVHLRPGDRVLGLLGSSWLPGRAESIAQDAIVVAFAKGDRLNCAATDVRAFDWTVGTRVSCDQGKTGTFAPGRIAAIDGDKVRVQLDGGTEVETDLSACRSP
jgi:hypothetical protein